MSLWQILVVIGIIVIPLIASVWLTLWTVQKRGIGPKPTYRPKPEDTVSDSDREQQDRVTS